MLSSDLGSSIPYEYALKPNYPNPFNPVTNLSYDLPEDALVNITIYDMMGRKVRTLVSQSMPPGYHTTLWNATNDNEIAVSAGMYIYTIHANEFYEVKKMILLK